MRTILFLFSLLALQTAPLLAQTAAAPAMPPCNGVITIVRVSEIKPGALNGFMDAVAAHQAWYRKNGIADNQIFASRVIVKDEKTGAFKYSDTEVLTYHVNPPDSKRTPHRGDDSWNAYVKMYRDTSDIKSEYITCAPKHEKL
jgi:hypothetical protein